MRMLQLLENLLVAGMWRLGRVDDAVEVLDHLERVFVSRIAMVELVLDEACKAAKLGNVFTEELNLVHPPQNAGNLSLVLHDAEKRIAGFGRTLKRAIHPFQTLPNLRAQLRAQFHFALLHVAEHAYQPQRVLFEDRRLARGDQAVTN